MDLAPIPVSVALAPAGVELGTEVKPPQPEHSSAQAKTSEALTSLAQPDNANLGEAQALQSQSK